MSLFFFLLLQRVNAQITGCGLRMCESFDLQYIEIVMCCLRIQANMYAFILKTHLQYSCHLWDTNLNPEG